MNADYITNPLYENNPFIEALPPMLAGKDLIRALASIPPYSDNDRDRSTGERLQLLCTYKSIWCYHPSRGYIRQATTRDTIPQKRCPALYIAACRFVWAVALGTFDSAAQSCTQL